MTLSIISDGADKKMEFLYQYRFYNSENLVVDVGFDYLIKRS